MTRLAGTSDYKGPGNTAPTRRDGGMHNQYVEEHPAYGMIAATRMGHGGRGGTRLFASDFGHHNTVSVTIRKGHVSRSDISTEHYMGIDEVVEVELSEAQWATFVATPNVGTGVPCTIRSVGLKATRELTEAADEYGYLPGIIQMEDRRTQFKGELADRMADTVRMLNEMLETAPTKKVREQIEHIIRQLSDGLPWVAQMFDEHMEQTVEKAKIDLAAYMTNAIMMAGVKALGGEPPLELRDGE